KADCLKITANDQPLSLAAQIKTGEVDVAPQIDGTTAVTLSKDSNIEIVTPRQGSVLEIAMWIDTPPFNDARVREALKLVADREALVKTVLLGYGSVADDNPIPPTSPAAFEKQPMYKPDIAKAKQLLAEAGHQNGLALDLYTADVIPGLV